jgi:hypothetical protein
MPHPYAKPAKTNTINHFSNFESFEYLFMRFSFLFKIAEASALFSVRRHAQKKRRACAPKKKDPCGSFFFSAGKGFFPGRANSSVQ